MYFVGRVWQSTDNSEFTEGTERVTLGTVEGEIRAHTKVDDWVHRPREFEHISLHDFLSSVVVKRLSSQARERLQVHNGDEDDMFPDIDHREDHEDTSEYTLPYDNRRAYPFAPEHPQYETHAVFLLKDQQRAVVNFVGGMLPRKDVGDYEYYCRTMLVLFHPHGWRAGTELKGPEDTWAAAFSRCQFSELSLQMMKNMNLLYECHDSRDDFRRARLISGKREKVPGFLTDAMMDELDAHMEDANVLDDNTNSLDAASLEESFDAVGNYTAGNRQQILAMENELRQIDREAFVHAEERAPLALPHVVEAPVMSSGQWRATVQHARTAAILAQRGHAPPSNSASPAVPSVTQGNNRVELLSVLDPQKERFLDPKLYLSGVKPPPDMEAVVQAFTLNDEQRRAFVIAASYIAAPQQDPLLMYLGGTGGTGKSRVLHALKRYLEDRAEAHRFAVAAPTGAAASLVGGSTYHSMLAFGGVDVPDSRGIPKVQDNLGPVDVIFVDEISMLSCQELYRISAQLCKAFKRHDVPFGGKSVILAGDFAQLPPPGRGSTCLYNENVGPNSHGGSLADQKKALGRAIWHMFTTVVILRQNMRQSGTTEKDEKFRTALDNIRVGAATEDDLALLRTRLVSRDLDGPNLGERRFRDVSVITPRNAHRDGINHVSVQRFAAEHNTTLHRFYSLDRKPGHRVSAGAVADFRTARDRRAVESGISDALQRELWGLPPCVTQHVPGVLDICLGLPVMLKHNEAVELCATNGAEGEIVGWQAEAMADG